MSYDRYWTVKAVEKGRYSVTHFKEDEYERETTIKEAFEFAIRCAWKEHERIRSGGRVYEVVIEIYDPVTGRTIQVERECIANQIAIGIAAENSKDECEIYGSYNDNKSPWSARPKYSTPFNPEVHPTLKLVKKEVKK